jgi:hypothetical protein
MKSLLFFSAWQSRGISKRNIQYIAYIPPHVNVFHSHFVTCCIVPTFGFFHISPSSASATPFRKISRKHSPQGIRHLLCLCLQGRLNRKCSFEWDDLLVDGTLAVHKCIGWLSSVFSKTSNNCRHSLTPAVPFTTAS